MGSFNVTVEMLSSNGYSYPHEVYMTGLLRMESNVGPSTSHRRVVIQRNRTLINQHVQIAVQVLVLSPYQNPIRSSNFLDIRCLCTKGDHVDVANMLKVISALTHKDLFTLSKI
ncbi:hypothetical protein C8R41DRAFT_363848 [Lentinula lateritia]|uniref:Uncharacterized protein n=1 Tax=Lentinula lateritia TaxID=40482 RepID=A0ABQ8VX72_9AGAR|nr:hypothetical protein C8R41DRAFT_363848 [Lentinula lateritia]